MKVSIIGCNYYGLFNGLVYAYRNKNYNFDIIDVDNKCDIDEENNKLLSLSFHDHHETMNTKIKDINTIFSYINLSTNIKFTHDIDIIKDSDIVFITDIFVDTDIIIDKINKLTKHKAIIVIKNCKSIGYTDTFIDNTNDNKHCLRKDLEVFNIPDYVIKYVNIDTFFKQMHKIVIGRTKQTTQEGLNKLKSLFISSEYILDIVIIDAKTAELSKLYNILMIAQQITTLNIIKSIAYKYDISYSDIKNINDIEPVMYNTYGVDCIGYSNSDITKDIKTLSNQCDDTGFAKYIHDTDVMNNYSVIKVCDKLSKKHHPVNILVLGMNYENNLYVEDSLEETRIIDKIEKFINENNNIEEYDIEWSRIAPNTNKYYHYVLIVKHNEEHDKIINELLYKENVKEKNIIDLTDCKGVF